MPYLFLQKNYPENFECLNTKILNYGYNIYKYMTDRNLTKQFIMLASNVKQCGSAII